MGIIDLLSQAGPVVKFVMFLLLSASVLCWAVIFSKWKVIKRVQQENKIFLDAFWNNRSIEDVYSKIDRYQVSTIAAAFRSGFREFQRMGKAPAGREDGTLQVVERSLLRSSNAEIASLESNISWLATTASAAPFIGLFGTVWGIMTSFQSIGAAGAANLAVVAPGISEALIATAAGLAAAIPAAIAYNHFVNLIRRLAVDTDCFIQDFLNVIERKDFGTREER